MCCGITNFMRNSHSNAEWQATSELLTQTRNELLCGIWQKCRKAENGTERKNDVWILRWWKNQHRNLSKFAESKTAEFTQTLKNINCGTKEKTEWIIKRKKALKANTVYNSLRRNFLSEIPRIFTIFGS